MSAGTIINALIHGQIIWLHVALSSYSSIDTNRLVQAAAAADQVRTSGIA
jgi:hypothetical protein